MLLEQILAIRICIARENCLHDSNTRRVWTRPISISGTFTYAIPFWYCPHWFLVYTFPVVKYIVQQAFRFNTLLQSANIFFNLLQEMTHNTHHNASWSKRIWTCYCKFKFTWDCDEEMALLCNRYISPLWNRVIAQKEFSLTFTANQDLIRSSNFRDDITPAHIVCTWQEEDLALFPMSYCIAYLDSFRYSYPRCSFSTIPVLRHAIRHSFSFAPAPSFAWFF